jgi:predicted MPP superfamily phosphohydrolase
MRHPSSFHFSDALWDLWCIVSIVGIWPRYIEPNLIRVSHRSIALPLIPEALKGLKIVQFSDLHFRKNLSSKFLDRLAKKLLRISPDLLVFTGDFLSHSELEECDQERLLNFLNRLHAKYGCYAVFGNHDYASYVSVSAEGDYDLLDEEKKALIKRGFARLFRKTTLTKHITERARSVMHHEQLVELLRKTPFQLLENKNQTIKIKDSYLNICGLGEYILGKTDPVRAFQGYNKDYPGIVLLHNPDGLPLLRGHPGDIVLCGHTHGGQVNLPWMWKKFTLIENLEFKRGLFHYADKWVYVNRGISGLMKFRWFASPEILSLTLS